MAPEHEHAAAASGSAEHDENDVQLNEDDVVEIVEDDGPGGEPMDDDDEFGGYDGEIVIGGPGPDDEDMEGMEDVDQIEDNSWGASCEFRVDSLRACMFCDAAVFVREHDMESCWLTWQLCTSPDSPSSLSTCIPRSPTPLWPSAVARTTWRTSSRPCRPSARTLA